MSRISTDHWFVPHFYDAQFNGVRSVTADIYNDPYITYFELRKSGAVQHLHIPESGRPPSWFVLGYPEAEALLRCTEQLGNCTSLKPLKRGTRITTLADALRRVLIFLDDPVHDEMRKSFRTEFLGSLSEIEKVIRQEVDALLQPMKAKAKCDLVDDFALPLPVRVISHMLGLTCTDAEIAQLVVWSNNITGAIDFNHDTKTYKAAQSTAPLFARFIDQFLSGKRKPREGSILERIRDDQRTKTDSSWKLFALANCVLLFPAGHRTTTALICNSVENLLFHRDQFELLKAKPQLVGNAVNETLRFDPPVQLVSRLLLDDVPIESGRMRKGETVQIFIGSANRDPRKYEFPELFDVTRQGIEHLSFGRGPHLCLGIHLSKLEGSISLEAICEAFPHLSFIPGAPPQRTRSLSFRDHECFPIQTG